jgi:hypothetical protein
LIKSTVSEGQNFLHIELVNENPNNGGIVATSKVALNQVFDQGKDTKWIQLNSSSGQQYGELKLELSFSVKYLKTKKVIKFISNIIK